MSLDEHELSGDEALEVSTGTRIPYTMVGDWVLLSSLSPQAKLLYALLAAHVNVASGSTKVWPSLETLAELLSLKNARSVSRYVDELVAFGAIGKVTHRNAERMRTRNTYFVNGEPPSGIATPVKFAEYYKARTASRRLVSAGRPVVTSGAPQADQVERKPAGQPVVTSEVPRSADDLHRVVTCSAPELDQEIQLNEARALRERAPEPEVGWSADPDGDPDVFMRPEDIEAQRRRVNRRNGSAAAMNDSARSQLAIRIVSAFNSSLPRSLPRGELIKLGQGIDEAFGLGWTEDEIVQVGLPHWNRSRKGAFLFISIASEAVSRGSAAKLSTADQAVVAGERLRAELAADPEQSFLTASRPRAISGGSA